MTKRMSPWPNLPTRFSRPRASTMTARVAAWDKHNAVLRERTEWLNGQRFDALHYSGPGTDLTIGLGGGP